MSVALICVALVVAAGCGGGTGVEGRGDSPECDPNYAGACLDPNAVDYDCRGGSGDGPLYTGRVTVVGSDHYGLDRDGDGVGCES